MKTYFMIDDGAAILFCVYQTLSEDGVFDKSVEALAVLSCFDGILNDCAKEDFLFDLLEELEGINGLVEHSRIVNVCCDPVEWLCTEVLRMAAK